MGCIVRPNNTPPTVPQRQYRSKSSSSSSSASSCAIVFVHIRFSPPTSNPMFCQCIVVVNVYYIVTGWIDSHFSTICHSVLPLTLLPWHTHKFKPTTGSCQHDNFDYQPTPTTKSNLTPCLLPFPLIWFQAASVALLQFSVPGESLPLIRFQSQSRHTDLPTWAPLELDITSAKQSRSKCTHHAWMSLKYT